MGLKIDQLRHRVAVWGLCIGLGGACVTAFSADATMLASSARFTLVPAAPGIVTLEIANNDGALQVTALPTGHVGSVKLAELWSDGSPLEIDFAGGTRGYVYRVAFYAGSTRETTDAESPQTFEVVGVGGGQATGEPQPRVLVSLFQHNGAAPGVLDGRPVEANPASSESSEPPPVLRSRLDDDSNLLVDMTYWNSATSKLSMTYANKIGPQAARLDTKSPYEQIAFEATADFGLTNIYLRTDRGFGNRDFGAAEESETSQWDMLQYGFNSRWGQLDYGSSYSYAGREYDDFLLDSDKKPKRDRELSSVWASWPSGKLLSFTAAFEEKRKDLDRDSDKTHYVDQTTSLSTTLTFSRWPYFSSTFWYAEGRRVSDHVPLGKTPYRGDLRSIGTSLYFQNDWGYHGISSSYTDVAEAVDFGSSRKDRNHSFYSAFYLRDSLSFGLSLSYSQDSIQHLSYLWSGTYFSESFWTKFHSRDRGFDVSWSSYRNRYETGDGYTNYAGLYNSLTLTFPEIFRLRGPLPLSVTVQHAKYVDGAYPQFNQDGVTVWLQVGLAPALRQSAGLPSGELFGLHRW